MSNSSSVPQSNREYSDGSPLPITMTTVEKLLFQSAPLSSLLVALSLGNVTPSRTGRMCREWPARDDIGGAQPDRGMKRQPSATMQVSVSPAACGADVRNGITAAWGTISFDCRLREMANTPFGHEHTCWNHRAGTNAPGFCQVLAHTSPNPRTHLVWLLMSFAVFMSIPTALVD